MKRLPSLALASLAIVAITSSSWLLQAEPDGPVGPVKPVHVVNEPLLTQVQGPLTVEGTIDVGNFPDPQNVVGTVNVGNFPDPQNVVGTVTVGNFPDPQNVQIVGQPVQVDVLEDVMKVSLFESEIIPAGGSCIGPIGGLDLTGFKEYRLVLRFDGAAPGDTFTINELYGPAGDIAQLNSDIDSGSLGLSGVRNYRHAFDVYGPEAFFIRVFNDVGNAGSMEVSGSLYAIK